jgi:ribosomal protein S18 acetylase RimI-like enzyme
MPNDTDVLRMQVDLRRCTARPAWPTGVLTTQRQDAAAPAVHGLLCSAYRRGGGEVKQDYIKWLNEFTTDPEFDPSACILAWSGRELAGVALCWSSAFVKDLCVSESQRGRGLGEALVRAAMVLFANRGVPALSLKVDVNNPSEAPRLYQRCGFEVVERITVKRHDAAGN